MSLENIRETQLMQFKKNPIFSAVFFCAIFSLLGCNGALDQGNLSQTELAGPAGPSVETTTTTTLPKNVVERFDEADGQVCLVSVAAPAEDLENTQKDQGNIERAFACYNSDRGESDANSLNQLIVLEKGTQSSSEFAESSKQKIKDAIARCPKNSKIVFHYSGHGGMVANEDPSKEPTYDFLIGGQSSDTSKSIPISPKSIQDQLDQTNQPAISVLDCCKAGKMCMPGITSANDNEDAEDDSGFSEELERCMCGGYDHMQPSLNGCLNAVAHVVAKRTGAAQCPSINEPKPTPSATPSTSPSTESPTPPSTIIEPMPSTLPSLIPSAPPAPSTTTTLPAASSTTMPAITTTTMQPRCSEARRLDLAMQVSARSATDPQYTWSELYADYMRCEGMR
jgi:ferredoxin